MNLKKNELRECLKEMSLTDEEREEVHRSLTNLMMHDNLLCDENDSLYLRLKDYENRSLSREVELLKEHNERISLLDN